MTPERDEPELAGIQYAGLPGISKPCLHAVFRILQYNDAISGVAILSSNGTHCLLLTINKYHRVAIKSGFGSGYGGEGARTFSRVLAVLDAHSITLEEYEVGADLIERLDSSALTESDLASIRSANPIRPVRWHEYVSEDHWRAARSGRLLTGLPPVVPFAIIDPRIIDLATSFWEDPDQTLLTGYRRLEDIVRDRIESDKHGQALFSEAFLGNDPVLCWPECQESERRGRGNIFTGTFMAHRNPRAHKERRNTDDELLREFLLLNHLFVLESRAQTSPNASIE